MKRAPNLAPDETQRLRDLWNVIQVRIIADLLGRPVWAIYRKASRMGLK